MSDHRKKTDRPEYTVEEILAEYGSKGSQTQGPKRPEKARKVVEFPTEKLPPLPRDGEDVPQPTSQRAKKNASKSGTDKPVPEIVPENVGRFLGARFHTLLRRADNFADHMYDQTELDEAARRAEKYIPGVDKEELPEEEDTPRRPRLRVVRQRESDSRRRIMSG